MGAVRGFASSRSRESECFRLSSASTACSSPNVKAELRVAEFFAGIGLMRMGLEQAGWQVVWANDIDADKARMYRGHYSKDAAHFHLGDIHALAPSDLPTVTLATASFPCNDLSLAGARRGLAGEQSGAFWGFVEAIRGMGKRRPPLVLLENVPGFLTSNDGNDFRDACLALNELGYAVDAFVIDAARFVPQSRQRLFVVGNRTPTTSIVNETSSLLESTGRPAALSDFILWHPEINWSLRPLPPLPTSDRKLPSIIETISPNSTLWWSRDRCEYLLRQMSVRHHDIADRMIGGGTLSYGTVFRRVRKNRSMAELRTDGIAGCLRTPRGGSGRQILFVAGRGNFNVRLLTPRECARLMGAEDFEIDPSISSNQALFGFGDAVCVSVIRWIAENYLAPLLADITAPKEIKTRQKSVRYGRA